MLRISYEIEIAKKIMEHQRYVRETEEKLDNLKLYMVICSILFVLNIVCVVVLW